MNFSLTISKACSPVPMAKRGIKINRERKIVRKTRAKFAKALAKFFKKVSKEIASDVTALLTKNEASLIERVLGSITLAQFISGLPELARPYISAIAVDGGDETLDVLGITSPEVIELMRARASEWSYARSAELVGRRIVDGQLVPNPNAEWAITDSTRDLLRDTITDALREGLSPAELAGRIEESYAFSSSRATMVARTEMAMADMAGSMEAFRATPGVQGKRWLTAGDDLVSDECQACEDAGTIPLDSAFPGGADAPPNHPNCRCAIEPVFDDEMES